MEVPFWVKRILAPKVHCDGMTNEQFMDFLQRNLIVLTIIDVDTPKRLQGINQQVMVGGKMEISENRVRISGGADFRWQNKILISHLVSRLFKGAFNLIGRQSFLEIIHTSEQQQSDKLFRAVFDRQYRIRQMEELGAMGEDVDAEREAQRIPDGADEAIDKDRRGRLTAPGWQEV